jgi:hypothetical protein
MNIQHSSADVPTNMTNSCNREYDLQYLTTASHYKCQDRFTVVAVSETTNFISELPTAPRLCNVHNAKCISLMSDFYVGLAYVRGIGLMSGDKSLRYG